MLLQVVPYVYLGNRQTAYKSGMLQSFNITKIVNVGGGPSHFPHLFSYLELDVKDDAASSVLSELDHTSDFIHASVQAEEGVVVHCMGGFSRSPTVICAYLIRYHGLSVEQSLGVIRKVRPVANPNPNFLRELKQYERQCRKKNQCFVTCCVYII